MARLPSEVRRAIKTLQDDRRWDLLLMLSENGELSFSGIQQEMNLSSPNLTYHLQSLQESALVENFFKKVENVDSHSFYRVTEFGQRLIDSLFKILSPGPILIEYKQTHEREITIKDTWTNEIRFTKLPPPQKPMEGEYIHVTVEGNAQNE